MNINKTKSCPFCDGVDLNFNADDARLMCDTVECNGCGALAPSAEWNDRADEWISVHDKKPKYGTPVILSVNNVVQDITYNLDGSDDSLDWFEPHSSVGAYDDLKDISFFVTHDIDVKWMKLPSQPKAASCGE